ncbi:hypothetical protein ACLB2K_040527 [Fragaria x ananassa]
MARELSPREVDCVHDFSGRLADIPSQLPGEILHSNASPDYNRYWKGVLHRKYNLPYTEVHDDGTKKIVGHFKDFEAEGMDKKRKERDKTSSDKKVVREHHPKKSSSHFKPKVAFEEFMYKTHKGVKMIIHPKSPFDPLGNNRIKFISSSSPRGPPVHIKLSDMEHDHGKDSKQGRIDSSSETSGVESTSDGDESMRSGDEINRDDESMSNDDEDNGNKSLSNGDQVNMRSDELEHESDKQEQDQPLDITNTRTVGTAANELNEEDVDTGMMETTTNGFNDQETIDAGMMEMATNGFNGQETIDTGMITPSSEHVSADDQLTATKAQCHDSSRPARGHTSEWVACMDDFATRFNSNVESPLSMDDIASQLSRDIAEFQGMRVSLELVSPLTKFSKKYYEGNLLSLVNREYTLKKKNKLIEEFGMMLLSMEAWQVKNEEIFLVWRDACHNFMEAGFNVRFLLDSLMQAARQYFGYMMRPEGSDDCCARVCVLQVTILQKKEELVRFEEELGKTQSDLGFTLPDVPVSVVEYVLESSWKYDGHAAHYLY